MPHIWPRGPGLLCVFGMGGPETLITNFLMRTTPALRRRLMTHEFTMIELHEREIILPQDTLAFAHHWQCDVLAELLPTTSKAKQIRHKIRAKK
jgi:hypothetical protein